MCNRSMVMGLLLMGWSLSGCRAPDRAPAQSAASTAESANPGPVAGDEASGEPTTMPTDLAADPTAGTTMERVGMPPLPAELSLSLAPWLGVESWELTSVASDGSLLGVHRVGALLQAVTVQEAMGVSRPLFEWPQRVSRVEEHPAEPGVLLFRSDEDGNERFVLYRREANGEIRPLTQHGFRSSTHVWSPDGTRLVHNSNARTGEHFDLWISDGRTEASNRLLVQSDTYWVPLDWSPDGRSVVVQEYVSSSESSLLIVDVDAATASRVPGQREGFAHVAAAFSSDGRELYVVTDRGGEFRQLWRTNLSTGEWVPQTEDLAHDIEAMEWNRDRSVFALSINASGASRIILWRPATGDRSDLGGLPTGAVGSMSFDASGERLAMTLRTGSTPGDAYVCETQTAQCTRWTEQAVAMGETATPIEAEIVTVTAADGVVLSGILYRPAGPGPHPVVVSLHGGPASQSRPTFDPLVQILAAQAGVAVLEPNVRGSSGFGRTFQMLDDGPLRGNAVADVGRFLDWIAADAGLDESRVFCRGGSYGGYLTLMALTHYPDRFIGGISSVGIVNLATFLENTEDYRRAVRRTEYGDESDAAQREWMLELSPIRHLDKLRAPLLIAHGARDPRVPLSEAQQVIEALRSRDVPVWSLIAPDEGHGYKQAANRNMYLLTQVQFVTHVLATGR